jgi:hypothetical protein
MTRVDAAWMQEKQRVWQVAAPDLANIDFIVDATGFKIGLRRVEFTNENVEKRKTQICDALGYLIEAYAFVFDNLSEKERVQGLSCKWGRPYREDKKNIVSFTSEPSHDGLVELQLSYSRYCKITCDYIEPDVLVTFVDEKADMDNDKLGLVVQMFVDLY